MVKKVQGFLILMLAAAGGLVADQSAKTPPAKESAPLSKEELEILKNREILENLELLQNLDKCRMLDLFLDISDAEKASAKPATKKDEQKKK